MSMTDEIGRPPPSKPFSESRLERRAQRVQRPPSHPRGRFGLVWFQADARRASVSLHCVRFPFELHFSLACLLACLPACLPAARLALNHPRSIEARA